MDFRRYYNLESYLFETVGPAFRRQGYLSALDFFCIVIWKANRAKSKTAATLLKRGHKDLHEAVRELTTGLARKSAPEDKLRYLWEQWHLRLPMASAILSVLYPEDFTVYDVRVCSVLGGFRNLNNLTAFGAVWRGYQEFREAVVGAAPMELALRDKDRYLWGKSLYQQLETDIQQSFGLGGPDSSRSFILSEGKGSE